MSDYSLFVSCPRGLEPVLAVELAAQHAADITPGDGGIACRGSLETVYRINLHSRTASRVLLRVAHGAIRHEQDVYALAAKTAWPQWFAVQQTFKIHIEGNRAPVKSLDFTALKV